MNGEVKTIELGHLSDESLDKLGVWCDNDTGLYHFKDTKPSYEPFYE